MPGTDSYRFFQAGARTSVIYDGEKYTLTERRTITEEDVVKLAPEADIVLLEGFKWSGYPKIEVVRRETGKEPAFDLSGRLAYASDREILQSPEKYLPIFPINDVEAVGKFIIEAYETGVLRKRWNNGRDEGSLSGSL